MLQRPVHYEFYDMYDITNRILTILGLSFMERSKTTDSCDLYRLSWKRLAYGCLFSLFVIFILHQQLTRFYPKDMDDNIVVVLLYWYMTLVGTLMAILMIVTAVFAAIPLSRLLNDPEFFELFSIRELYAGLKINSVQQIVFSLSVLTACYISDYVADQNFTIQNAIKLFFFFFFPMYNSFCISQFFNTHYWLQGLYRNVNNSLENLLDSSWWERQHVQVSGIMEMAKTYDTGKGLTNLNSEPVVDRDFGVSCELLTVRRLYNKIHKVRNILNDAYSTRNILLFLHHCALIIIYTYWGLRHILDDHSSVPLTAKLNYFKAAFMSIVSLVSMLWPCATTRVEANRTVHLAQDLLAKVKYGHARDELHIFCLQLHQEKYQFAPHGFFEMDNKLLLSLLAVVTSYLIILLQYHMVNIALEESQKSLLLSVSSTVV